MELYEIIIWIQNIVCKDQFGSIDRNGFQVKEASHYDFPKSITI
jgi:hypothetical protein